MDEYFKNHEEVGVVGIQTTFEGYFTNNFEALQGIAKEYQLDIPLGHSGWAGKPSPLIKRYQTRGTPWVAIIDRKGQVRVSHFHFEPKQSIAFMEKLLREK